LPDARVREWSDAVDGSELFTSVLVLGEIRRGIERLRRRGDTQQSDAFERWLDQLKVDFTERILGVTTTIAERWGRLNALRPLPSVDGLIAATAIEHDLTLVTRDTSTLAGTGVRLENPWA
jgi:toxin FitB